MADRIVLDRRRHRSRDQVGFGQHAIDPRGGVDGPIRVVAHTHHDAIDAGGARQKRDGQVVRVAPQHRHDDIGLPDVRLLEHGGDRGVAVQRDQPVCSDARRVTSSSLSTMVMACPSRVRCVATSSPARPAPTMTIFIACPSILGPVRHGRPQDVFVDRGDVPGRGAIGDQAAPCGIENGGLARGQHGRQRDVRVRIFPGAPQLALGIDDVALVTQPSARRARGATAGPLASRLSSSAWARRARDENRPAFLGDLVLSPAGDAEPRQEGAERQRLRDAA